MLDFFQFSISTSVEEVYTPREAASEAAFLPEVIGGGCAPGRLKPSPCRILYKLSSLRGGSRGFHGLVLRRECDDGLPDLAFFFIVFKAFVASFYLLSLSF